jgi:aryl-alcohol dehydrogenase-like predicted oxidoreductase
VIIRGGVARGTPTDWEHRNYGMVAPSTLRDRWEEAHLDDLLDGMGRMEFMLRFTLANPYLDATIVGTSNVEHLHANVAAAVKGPLPDDLVTEAKRRLGPVA